GPTRAWPAGTPESEGSGPPASPVSSVVRSTVPGAGQNEVGAGGPGIGPVAQTLAGAPVEILGESRPLAQRAEGGAHPVGEPEVTGPTQTILDEHGGRRPDWAAPVSVRLVVGGSRVFGVQAVRREVCRDVAGQRLPNRLRQPLAEDDRREVEEAGA